MCMYAFKCACCSRTCAFIHLCVRNSGTARERKNSSHLHSVYSVAAVEANCQAERRDGGDVEGVGRGVQNVCDVITSASGCRKPYIKEVYVCGIKAKGVNRTEKALSAAPFRSTPSCASVARKKSPSSFRMIQPSSSECVIQEHLVNILNPGAFGVKLHHIAKCFL